MSLHKGNTGIPCRLDPASDESGATVRVRPVLFLAQLTPV